MIDEGQEPDEAFAIARPAFADVFLGDIVAAVREAAEDGTEVEIGAGQSAKPDM
jgi:hypothetical protein